MKLNQWERAMPYAEGAAQSGSHRSMECAARCAEGLKDWKRAEAWHQMIAERYDQYAWSDWYYFCKRTGHGDLKAARDFGDQAIKERANGRDPVGEEDVGCFYWLDGRTEKAKAVLYKAYKERSSLIAAGCLAMIADDANDAGRRNQLIKEVIPKYKNAFPKLMETCQVLLDTILEPDGKKSLDKAALDRLIGGSASLPGFGELLVGWFLKNHGQADTAKKLLERCANSTNVWIGFRSLASDAMTHLAPK
jgi:hypothetical protein